jgi:hypothetical protein
MRPAGWALGAVLCALALLLVLQAHSSLRWRIDHDTPLLHYVAWMMREHGAAPYRDIFETSLPGTFAFHWAILATVGDSNLAFRCVDLVLLATVLAATFAFMRRFGTMPALWAVVTFGLIYLWQGEAMSLQKDYVGLVPITWALAAIPADADRPIGLRRLALVGFLFGLAIIIKPHLAMGLPVFLVMLLAPRAPDARPAIGKCLLAASLAAGIPLAVALGWLASQGALASFFEIEWHYLPLHTQIDGFQEVLTGRSRVVYDVDMFFRFGGFGAIFFAALFAAYRMLAHPTAPAWKRGALFLLACTLVYAIYPVPANKFWPYHYMPFVYFCSIAAALGMARVPETSASGRTAGSMAALVLLVAIAMEAHPALMVQALVQEHETGAPLPPRRADEIGDWLRVHLRPGDTVQPLDWTGGAVNGMLLAHAPLATRFLYDYHFYHHVANPYIQQLRTQFMSQLREARPRFVIQVNHGKPWVRGEGTTREFPQLESFLAQDYRPAFEGAGYRILERR